MTNGFRLFLSFALFAFMMTPAVCSFLGLYVAISTAIAGAGFLAIGIACDWSAKQ